MIKFIEFLMQKESSPATRTRDAAMRGTGHDITDADMLGGHSTNPWYVSGKKKKKKKK